MSLLVVRFLGIGACLATSWVLAAVAIFPLLLVRSNEAEFSRWGFSKWGIGIHFQSDIPRLIMVFISTTACLYGMVVFPYFSPTFSMVIALAFLCAIVSEHSRDFNQRVRRMS